MRLECGFLFFFLMLYLSLFLCKMFLNTRTKTCTNRMCTSVKLYRAHTLGPPAEAEHASPRRPLLPLPRPLLFPEGSRWPNFNVRFIFFFFFWNFMSMELYIIYFFDKVSFDQYRVYNIHPCCNFSHFHYYLILYNLSILLLKSTWVEVFVLGCFFFRLLRIGLFLVTFLCLP